MFKVTCIDLSNGEFAIYINGHYLTSQDCSGARMYAGDLLESLGAIPGVMVEHVDRELPGHEDWCWNDVAGTVFSPAADVQNVTVGALMARLQEFPQDALCVGTFWLSDDFLSLDDSLQPEEIHEAMQIAEKRHDCNYGYNWEYLQSCIDEVRQSS